MRSRRTRPSPSLRAARLAAVALVALLVPIAAGRGTDTVPGASPCAAPAPILPLAFVPNVGQFPEPVRYLARSGSTSAFALDRGFVLRRRGPEGRHALGLTFEARGESAPALEGVAPLDAPFHFLVGDPDSWRTDVQGYGGVRWRGLAPGVDLELRAREGKLVYDLFLAAGADPGDVVVRVDGATSLTVDARGRLVIATPIGEVVHDRLAAFAVSPDGGRRAIRCAFTVLDDARFGLSTAAVDADETLVIDPQLELSTYVGGTPANPLQQSVGDAASGVAVDAVGNVYVTGYTDDADFPSTPGSYDPSFNGSAGAIKGDAFVVALDPEGSSLRFATFLGGDRGDQATDIALGPGGDLYVCGATDGGSFPFTASFGQSLSGTILFANLSFVSRLTADGTALVWSVRLTDCRLEALAVDAAGAATAVGVARGSGSVTGFPTTPGAYDTTFAGGADQCVTRIDPGGAVLQYSTFLGGSAGDTGFGVVLDGAGDAWVCGESSSFDFPATGFDAFHSTWLIEATIAHLSASGAALLAASFLGDDNSSSARGVARASNGDVVLTGRTWAFDGAPVPFPFPTTPNAFDTTFGGAVDGFAAVFDPTLNALNASTFVGGSFDDVSQAVGVDAADRVVVTGQTWSADFPTTPNAFDPQYSPHAVLSTSDGTVARFSPDLATLDYGTYLGGSHNDTCDALALGPAGVVHVAGATLSPDLPTTADAFDPIHGGNLDGWTAKLEVCGGAFFEEHGQGCPGGGGVTPRLRGDGCPEAFAQVLLRLDRGPPGSTALFVFAPTAGATPLFPACTLAIAPLLPLVVAVPLAVGGPLPGGFAAVTTAPPVAAPLDVHLQAVVIDPAAPGGASASNALRVHLQ